MFYRELWYNVRGTRWNIIQGTFRASLKATFRGLSFPFCVPPKSRVTGGNMPSRTWGSRGSPAATSCPEGCLGICNLLASAASTQRFPAWICHSLCCKELPAGEVWSRTKYWKYTFIYTYTKMYTHTHTHIWIHIGLGVLNRKKGIFYSSWGVKEAFREEGICVLILLLGKACAQGTDPSQGKDRFFLVQPWTPSLQLGEPRDSFFRTSVFCVLEFSFSTAQVTALPMAFLAVNTYWAWDYIPSVAWPLDTISILTLTILLWGKYCPVLPKRKSRLIARRPAWGPGMRRQWNGSQHSSLSPAPCSPPLGPLPAPACWQVGDTPGLREVTETAICAVLQKWRFSCD